MSKAYEFLKECGIFYVLTVNGDMVLKQKMYDENKILQMHHKSADFAHGLEE